MGKSILLLFAIISSLLISCSSNSNEELEMDVKASIIEEWKDDPNFSVIDLSLINTENDTYEGFVNTIEGGEEFQYNLTVWVDGDEFIWELY
jgi:hypothetical protein